MDSMYNNSRNISQVYRGWLHSLGTRSAVDLKRYSNISQVYRGLLHSLGTRSAVDILKVFSTRGDADISENLCFFVCASVCACILASVCVCMDISGEYL